MSERIRPGEYEVGERYNSQPEGAPPLGYEFEVEYGPFQNSSSKSVHLHRVTGWVKYKGFEGERVSVRAFPISHRERRVVGAKQCDMGHTHPIYDGEPPKGTPPDFWGFSSEDAP